MSAPLSFEGKAPSIDPTAFVAPGAQLIGDLPIKPLVINYLKWHQEISSGFGKKRRLLKLEVHATKGPMA